MVPSRRAFEQDGLIGSQPDDGANPFQKIDILCSQNNSAASHNDRRSIRRQFAKDFSFRVAEFLFTVLFKNLCDRHSKFGRQHFVRIQTGEPTSSLQRTPYRRFSSAHHADEHDRFGRVHGAICLRSGDLKRSCGEPMTDQTPVCLSRNLWSPS
jgi:hypothetical protein